MSNLYSNSIFWIDTDKIKPNPYQPRRDFNETRLQNLADSIKQYGVLQPLTVSRVEIEKEDGGFTTEYELIAGERRLRAAKLAQVSQVPVIIRTGDTSMMKLELAIIENLQREDLNSVDRARAFSRLANEFKFTHNEIAKKIGRSREYVSNTLRILALPEEILIALAEGKISEGHTRPLLMLADHPEEQIVLFKEILYKKITVREAEKISRKIAYDRVRKKKFLPDLEIIELEEEFQDKLGTRVHIDRHELGGQIKIDYFSKEDLRAILDLINKSDIEKKPEEMLQNYIDKNDFEEKNEENLEKKEISNQKNLPANLSIEQRENKKTESLNLSELPETIKTTQLSELAETDETTSFPNNFDTNLLTNTNEDKEISNTDTDTDTDSDNNIDTSSSDTSDDTKLYDISNFSI